MTNSIPDLKAAVIDGRAEAPRFKQRQLLDLHAALQASHSQIVKAICADTNDTHAEADVQYQLSVHAVKEHYSALDLTKLLEAEYSLANSKDHLTRQTPYGCAYIVPAKQSLLYSVTSSVAAAIAAGNCIVVELPQTLRQTATLLRQIFAKSLDQDSYAIVDSDPFDEAFKAAHVVTLNSVPTANATSTSQNIQTPLTRTAAIVDRSADITSAAKDIVRARFAFSDQSHYAPDIVLVNEFCIKEFCGALAQNTLSFLTQDVNGSTTRPAAKFAESASQGSIAIQVKDSSDATIIASSPRGTIALIHNRNHKLLTAKVTEPVLLVHPITSMDDAIDFLNISPKGDTKPLLASYIFASPAATKYIGQFVSSNLTVANHIPVELLVGPPAPQGSSPNIHPRYSLDLFSRPSPQVVTQSPFSSSLKDLVDGVSEVKSLSSKLDLDIKPMNEPNANAVGFFEQGILLGLGIRLSSIVVATGVFVKYGLPVLTKRIGWR